MITILKPQPEDAEGIQIVYRDSWMDTYPNADVGITQEDIDEVFRHALDEESISKRKNQIEEDRTDMLFLVAKDGARVVGVCRAYIRHEYNQLQSIYILPEYQKKGIGRQFWEACLQFFDQMKDTVVDVATYNTKAIAFYKKCGFIDSGDGLIEKRYQMPISKVYIPEMRLVVQARKS